MGVDTHGQLLLTALPQIGSEVEETGVEPTLPRTHIAVVEPEVIAAQHTVEPDGHLLPLPGIRHGESQPIVARQGVRIVVARLAEAVRLPAARHRNSPPGGIGSRHGLVVRHTFYHFQLPLAIKAFHTGLVSHRPDAFVGIVHLGVSHQADYAQQACRQKLLHLICISISVRSSFFPPQLSPDGYLRTKLLKKHKSYKI